MRRENNARQLKESQLPRGNPQASDLSRIYLHHGQRAGAVASYASVIDSSGDVVLTWSDSSGVTHGAKAESSSHPNFGDNPASDPCVPSYCSFAYSTLACFKMGMSESASFQRVRKSL